MLLFFLAALAQSQSVPAESGSKACAGCHAEIYRSYMKTGMARSSGRTGDSRESFDRATVDSYMVGADYALRYGSSTVRKLEWFVGSGGLGRSYLFSQDGFLFQAPVSYYSAAAKWDISPGFEHARRTDFTRAVETGCLQCHASRLQPITGTRNGFRNPPFLEGGVSCERCHGPASEHIRSGGKRGIVNPVKLDTEGRDSVCAQCHLTGAARIARADAKPYRPGALLSDSLAVFTWAAADSDLNATSHFEKLARSACARKSSGKLWCGSCHDPHGATVDYNARCATCHQAADCRRGPDCVTCHMPKSEMAAMNHVAFTDHSIPRRRTPAGDAPALRTDLVSFWKGPASPRDLALGYAVVAQTEPGVRPRAFELLTEAADKNPKDVPVLAQLAQFYDRMGQEQRAMELCERILVLDPNHTTAAINLGIYRIKRGQSEEAIALWEKALASAPGQTGARVNLAVAKLRAGDKAGARAALVRALDFDPANDTARKLLEQLGREP